LPVALLKSEQRRAKPRKFSEAISIFGCERKGNGVSRTISSLDGIVSGVRSTIEGGCMRGVNGIGGPSGVGD